MSARATVPSTVGRPVRAAAASWSWNRGRGERVCWALAHSGSMVSGTPLRSTGSVPALVVLVASMG